MSETIKTSAIIEPALDLDQLIADLDEAIDTVPVEAIRAAQRHRELVIPRFIQLLRESAEKVAAGDRMQGNSQVFAMLLLTEFRATEAWPAIDQTITLPGNGAYDVYGDLISESMPRVLAALSVDRPEFLDELISNRTLNEYVPWSAAQAFLYHVRDGRLTREELVRRLQRHLRTVLDIAGSEITEADARLASALVHVLSHCVPREALDDLREAFQRGLVDGFLASLKGIEESLRVGDAGFQQTLDDLEPAGVTDTVDVVSQWSWFQESAWRSESEENQRIIARNQLEIEQLKKRYQQAKRETARLNGIIAAMERVIENPTSSVLDNASGSHPVTDTLHKTQPRVGRNEPCPCGSGKKYKKCCGGA